MGTSVGSAFVVTIGKAVAISLGVAIVATGLIITFVVRRRRRQLRV